MDKPKTSELRLRPSLWHGQGIHTNISLLMTQRHGGVDPTGAYRRQRCREQGNAKQYGRNDKKDQRIPRLYDRQVRRLQARVRAEGDGGGAACAAGVAPSPLCRLRPHLGGRTSGGQGNGDQSRDPAEVDECGRIVAPAPSAGESGGMCGGPGAPLSADC